MEDNKLKELHDILMHLKDTDKSEKIVLPVTRYENVTNAPNLITNGEQHPGAPFHLLATSSEKVSIADLRKMCGSII